MRRRILCSFALFVLAGSTPALAAPTPGGAMAPAAKPAAKVASGVGLATAAPDAKAGKGTAADDHRDAKRYKRHSGDIAVPIAFFLMVVLLVGLIQLMGYRKDRARHETLRVMVERGAEIPVALLSTSRRRPSSDLRRGVIWLAFGLGLTLCLAILTAHEDHHPWAIGLVPTLIGIGYLIVWKIERKDGGQQDEPAFPGGVIATRPMNGHDSDLDRTDPDA